MLGSIARLTRLQSRLATGALLLAAVGLSASGCTLVTDVDRSKIPAATPPDLPGPDAGDDDEEPPPPAEDAGDQEPPPDAAPDAAVPEDAAPPPEEPVDSGEPAPEDAG